MRRIGLLWLGILLWGLSMAPHIDAQELLPASKKRSIDQLMFRMPVGYYQLDIYKPSRDDYDGWLLKIGDADEDLHYYSEVIDDPPVAASCFGSSCRFIVTIWGKGASSYGVRVYHVPNQQNIRKVLEEFGRGMPEATSSTDGSPEITITDYQTPISEQSMTTQEIWRWDGGEYKSLGEKCVAYCGNDNRVR